MDASSFGWVYCGSHNFSAAAWGRPIHSSVGEKANEPGKANSSLGSRLHVCNYELGIVFIFPPNETEDGACKDLNFDDIVLPFSVPAPKYGPTDRPASARAMREALNELREQEIEKLIEVEEIPDEEDQTAEATDFDREEKEEENEEEKEEEKAYAEILWNLIDSSQSC